MAQGLSPEQMEALKQIAMQTSQGLTQVIQAISRIDQSAAEQLAGMQKAFQELVMAAMQGQSGPAQGGERPAEAGAADVRPAQ